MNEPSPRPWQVIKMIGLDEDDVAVYVADANNSSIALMVAPAENDAENAQLIVDAVNERDRLRDALNEVCCRVSVALNCPRHETEEIDLLVHYLLGIKECASAAIGEDKK